MPRVLRMLNLGASGDPDTFVVDSLPLPGQIGGCWEDNGQKRWQLFQVVDAGASAADVLYAKAHDGTYTATPTIGNSSMAEAAGIAGATITANQYALLRQGGTRTVKANGLFARGTLVAPDSASNRAVPAGNIASGALGSADTGGGVLSWQNPYSDPIAVEYLAINRTTKSTGAGTADFGWTTTRATTSSDLLIDGLDTNAAEAVADNIINHGTNGLAVNQVPAGKWVTGSKASGAMAGLVGTWTIRFTRLGNPHAKAIGVAQGAINTGVVSTFLTIEPL